MKRCLAILLTALVAVFLLPGEVLGQACVSPDGLQCIYLAPMLGANTCPQGWTPVSSCPSLPGYCYNVTTGMCWSVPGILGSTCNPPHVWSKTPCPAPPTPTPGPTPPPVGWPVSWDPFFRTPCFRADPGILPPYLAQCYESNSWRVEVLNIPPGEVMFGAGSTPSESWAVSLYVSNRNEPPPSDANLRWCGITLMTGVSAETSQDLWLVGRFTWAGDRRNAGDNCAMAMIVARDPSTGRVYELDVWFAGKMAGDSDPRPEYIVAPVPYPPNLDAWVVLDGTKFDLGLIPDGYGSIAIPVTAFLEKVSAENPETFPAPRGGWRATGRIEAMGVGVEIFEASWGALGVWDLTLWAGGMRQPVRKHLERRK